MILSEISRDFLQYLNDNRETMPLIKLRSLTAFSFQIRDSAVQSVGIMYLV